MPSGPFRPAHAGVGGWSDQGGDPDPKLAENGWVRGCALPLRALRTCRNTPCFHAPPSAYVLLCPDVRRPSRQPQGLRPGYGPGAGRAARARDCRGAADGDGGAGSARRPGCPRTVRMAGERHTCPRRYVRGQAGALPTGPASGMLRGTVRGASPAPCGRSAASAAFWAAEEWRRTLGVKPWEDDSRSYRSSLN
jgi:hypothetical protein